MGKRPSGFALAFCSLFFSFCAGTAWAGDINKQVEACAECHGKNGASTESDIPIIGGYSVEFLTNNLKAYRDKDRACPETKVRSGPHKGSKSDMCKVTKGMSDDDIQKIAQHFSKQKFVRAKQKFDPALARKGKELHDQYCEKCHSEGGTVADDDAGMPAGQWMPYLKHALDEFYTGKRPVPKKMKLKLEELNKDTDVDALINYYGSISK